MATLSALRSDLQTRFQDKNGGFLSATPANLYINMGCEDFVNDCQPMSREYGYYPTAKQFRYDLPSDYIHNRALMWYGNGIGNKIEFRSIQEFRLEGGMVKKAPGIPTLYTIIDDDIYLSPAPSSSSNTDTLGAAISSTSATSITVSTPANWYDHSGILLVDTEQIEYQSINTSTGVMSLCIRGTGGTTAATHLNGATCSRCDLVLLYNYSHTYMTSDSQSPAFSARFHRLPVQYALYLALKQSGNSEDAADALAVYMQQKAEAKREIRRQSRDIRNRKVSASYD